jgi:outer membrane protein, heavy metal efflux system
MCGTGTCTSPADTVHRVFSASTRPEHRTVCSGRLPSVVRPLGALAVGLLLATPSRAAAAHDYSWDEARAVAARAVPDLEVAAARREVSVSEVQVAAVLPNPAVGISTARETAKLSVALSQPLPVFGQRATQVRAAQADLETAGREVELLLLDVRHGASLAWVDLWEAERRATLLASAATDATRVADIARARFEAGGAPRLDVVRATADVARASADGQAAVRLVAAAGARLDYFVGIAAEASHTRGEAGLPDSLPATDAGELSRTAVHPLLARDAAAVRAAEAHLVAERRARWPTVAGDLTVSWGDPTLARTDIIAGVGFELPVLSLRGGAILRAQALQALAEATRDLDGVRLTSERRDASARFAATSLRARVLREQVLPPMEEARQMTEEGYREGRVDFVRVLEAQRALTESRLAWVDAAAAATRAYVDLERALGGVVAPQLTGERRAR